ncbi:unnamed protein product [Symbiodinium sp. CCMP2592]|nr:unnamed protein product [Symbiodinium sp. CCMP2592]
MDALLGTTLLDGRGEVATSSLQGGVVALYFSAGWCPSCEGFTPQFRKVYEQATSKNGALDVVFVSSDRDESSFQECFAKMPWHALPFADRQRQQQLSASFGIRGIPSVVLLNSSGQLLDDSARGKVMEPGFLLSLPRRIDLVSAALPEPTGSVHLRLRYKGREHDMECEPSEGWEMLRKQISSMIDVPPEQLKLFGLGLDKGQVDESISLTRALARSIATQKNSGLRVAKVPLEARRASSSHEDDKPGQRRGDCSPWYQLDLGEVEHVAGVLVAARRVECGQWATRLASAVNCDLRTGPGLPPTMAGSLLGRAMQTLCAQFSKTARSWLDPAGESPEPWLSPRRRAAGYRRTGQAAGNCRSGKLQCRRPLRICHTRGAGG